MSGEKNKALVRRFYDEVCNARRLEVITEIFTPDAEVNPPPSVGTKVVGHDAIAANLSIYHTAFPDAVWTLHGIHAGEANAVTVFWNGSGTHTGPLGGIPPTGRYVSIEAISVFVVRSHIVEVYDMWDALGLMRQIGVVPTAGE